MLALDPGFQAGIKCAISDPKGQVVRLETVEFLGNKRDTGVYQLRELLAAVKGMAGDGKVIVALGNGHGSQECRALVQEAASALTFFLIFSS